MHTEQEKVEFSRRLQTALKLAGLETLSHAHLANRFNLRHPNQSVSTQAFHHWLNGRSIPTADKIETLAKWLDTTPDWLRYGKITHDCGELSDNELLLLKYFRDLSESKQRALMGMLHEFCQ